MIIIVYFVAGISLITFVEVLYWMGCFVREALMSTLFPSLACDGGAGSQPQLKSEREDDSSQGTAVRRLSSDEGDSVTISVGGIGRFHRKESAEFLHQDAKRF